MVALLKSLHTYQKMDLKSVTRISEWGVEINQGIFLHNKKERSEHYRQRFFYSSLAQWTGGILSAHGLACSN